jgi:hypothetical protein
MLAALTAISIVVILAIPVLLMVQPSAFNQHEVLVQREATVEPSFCGELETTNPIEVLDVSEFNVEGWNLRTFGEPTVIGAVGSASFEATCAEVLLPGVMTYSKTENGHLVLRLAISQ